MHKALRAMLWIVGCLVVLGAAARLLLFESWVIPDDPVLAASIEPTLSGGDTVLVLVRGTPSFGELVRCPDPEEPGSWVVGRIAGTAGDNVELAGASLAVNGKRYESTDACTQPYFTAADPDTGNEMQMQCSRVEMGPGWHFRGISGKRLKQNDVSKRVGEGLVFLLSDNRDMHDDSRDFGPVPASSCQHRVVFRLWGAAGWTDSARRFTVIR